jgi:hypothetical protein
MKTFGLSRLSCLRRFTLLARNLEFAVRSALEGGPSMAAEDKPKKNEFEILAQFNQCMAQLIADGAQRFKHMAALMQPGKSSYTLGDFVLDQTKIVTNLLQAYTESAKSFASSSNNSAGKGPTTRPEAKPGKPSKPGKPRKRSKRRKPGPLKNPA